MRLENAHVLSTSMVIDEVALARLITEMRLVSAEALGDAQKTAKKNKTPLLSLLVSDGYISEREAAEITGDILGVSVVRISDIAIPDHVLRMIPIVVARAQRVIAISCDERGLAIAMEDPTNLQVCDFLVKKTGMPLRVFLATASDIDLGLSLYTKDIGKTFDEMMAAHVETAERRAGEKNDAPDAPIIRIVDTLFLYAYQNKASDIHIEPRDQSAAVRFRIDGILYDVLSFSMRVHEQVVARLKVLSRLRTDEHQVPQDGKIRAHIEGNEAPIDIRLSVVPTTDGEKIVLRLLAEHVRQFSLSTLGFSPQDLEKMASAYRKPHGMILSTGPTGSGKTTTLYAILKILNKPNINIMTIEDPVEYDMAGINQIQVNQRANLTFATGLRSILRQDPNIILVGEIRDEETSGIAINLAMTGHLVLSTLHANDAATTIPRLLDLGIEPFLIASTVSVIVAQRLVRKIHEPCRVSEEVSLELLRTQLSAELVQKLFPRKASSQKETTRVYRGKGCPLCHGSGYAGRVGIFEVLSMGESLRHAIMERATASEIQTIAKQGGMRTMIEDGIEKVRQGITTLDEVIRVARE